MDNQKIGAFISAMRKEQGLTQKELGTRIHVSDRAVSKWERGLNLPDAALFEPLCQELGITVTELLRGERTEATVPQMEQVMSDALALAQKKERAKKRYRMLALVLILVLLLAARHWAEQRWLDYKNQRYFDLDTTRVSVCVHYRDNGLSIDANALSGGMRIPRAQGGSVLEVPLLVTRPLEAITARDIPTFDLGREEDFYFSIPNPKTEMEIAIFCWYEDRIGTDVSFEEAQTVEFAPHEFSPYGSEQIENVYRFKASPNYLYSIVVYWGDGYFAENCFRTI